MNKLSLIAVTVIAATLSAAAAAAPNPATATFQVLIKIQKACAVTAASNIDFGTQDASATGLAGNNAISVTCSKGTSYSIGLAPAGVSTSGTGTMKALNVAPVTGNLDTVPYQLRSVSAGGANWGTGSGMVTDVGTGLAKSHSVYATIPSAGANVTPDSYADTVTVNVTY